MARIEISEENYLKFSDGTRIFTEYSPECCEYNFADFECLDTEAINYDFDTKSLRFEPTDYGFRFGDKSERMFFVPCYSVQNGYYSNFIDVYLNDKLVLNGVECELDLQ